MAQGVPPTITEEAARAIGVDAYIYFYSLLSMDITRKQFTNIEPGKEFGKGPMNMFVNVPEYPPADFKGVVRSNFDTLYSIAWLDLTKEPLIISAPDTTGRFYLLPMLDMWTDVFASPGWRTTGTQAGKFLVTPPGWSGTVPEGFARISAPTPYVWIIGRTKTDGPADYEAVHKIQAGYKAQPLSAFFKRPAPPAAPKIDFLPATTAGIKDNFFQYLDAALQYVPVTPQHAAIRAKLTRIGIGPGKTFEFKDLSLEHKAAILVAMKQGDDKVDKWLAGGMKSINGWRVGAFFGDETFYNGDWLMRASAAKGGLYGNDAVEAMYPYARTDAAGEPLDGSKHKYTITFPPGELPPVNAFWSVTMYDGKSQFLIKNPINRYLINSPMLSAMKKDTDGSLTLYIQKDNPGADKEANWLPAPDDKIYLVLRLYWPKPTPPSILPAGEGTWKPPGVKKVS